MDSDVPMRSYCLYFSRLKTDDGIWENTTHAKNLNALYNTPLCKTFLSVINGTDNPSKTNYSQDSNTTMSIQRETSSRNILDDSAVEKQLQKQEFQQNE